MNELMVFEGNDVEVKIQEMNPRTRTANMYLKIAKEVENTEHKNILYLKSAKVLVGEVIFTN